MTEFLVRMGRLAESEDTEGMVDLLESRQLRDDDWLACLQSRLRAPSSTTEQKQRLKLLKEGWLAQSQGEDLKLIRTSPWIFKKLLALEEEGADFQKKDVSEWLASVESLSLGFEKVTAIPKALTLLTNLKFLDLSSLRFRGELEWPQSLNLLDKLEVLNLEDNGLSKLPELPVSLKTLVVGQNHPTMEVDLSGLVHLQSLNLDGLETEPRGMEELVALESLAWRNSGRESFPESLLTLPKLSRDQIDLSGSSMSLPEVSVPMAAPFEASSQNGDVDEIAQAIEAYNQFVSAYQGYDDEEERQAELLINSPKANEADLEVLERLLDGKLPDKLKTFYMEIGGVRASYISECCSIWIPTVEEHLSQASLKERGMGGALTGLGLVDFIRWSWGFCRPEFEAGAELSAEEIEQLNERFTAFGIRRGSWGLEAADYLFMDQDGQCGSVYFHQDGSDTAEEMRELLVNGPEGGELGVFLSENFKKVAKERAEYDR